MQPTNRELDKNLSVMLEARLKTAIKLAGGVSKLAESTGFGASSIYNYQKLDPAPPIQFLYALSEASGVRAEWLLTGEAPMGSNQNVQESGAQPAIGDVRIPIVNVTASAGDGIDVQDEGRVAHLTFSMRHIMELGSPDHMEIITIEGDSMEPDLRSGDHVMIDKSQTRLADGLFAVSVDEHLFVKRVRVKGKLKADLVSANSAYPPFEITIADPGDDDDIQQDGARIIGRVVWTGRAL